MHTAETPDEAAGMQEAEAFLLTLRTWPTDGSELHAVLARALGYGQRDARLRGFCRRLQQELGHRRR